MKLKRVFLVGSGISFPAPSVAPSAGSIVSEIIRAISPTPVVARRLAMTCSQRHHRLPAGTQLVRFEQFLETIQETADPDLDVLDIFHDVRSPNALHLTLAQRALAGDLVFTTNFDCLLEEAVICLGGKPHSICSESEFRDYQRSTSSVPIFKLHGSLERFRPDSSPRAAKRTLGATIKSITRYAIDPLPPPGKLSIFLRSLRQAHVTVLGYSGSDDFDIIPALRITRPRSIVWVEHDSRYPQGCDATASLRRRLLSHPYSRLLTDRDRLFKLWLESAVNFHYHRQLTATYLSARFGTTRNVTPVAVAPVPSLRRYLQAWRRNKILAEADSYRIAGELLFRACQYRGASRYFHEALRRSHVPGKSTEIRLCLARSLVDCGEYSKARNVLRGISPEAKRGLTNAQRLRLQHARGFIAYKQRDFSEALHELRIARRMAQRQRNAEFLGTILHDMGILFQEFGRYGHAARHFQSALTHSRRAGNARHVNWSQYHLGIVSYYLASLSTAREQLATSMTTAMRLGDRNQWNNSEHALALLDFVEGRISDSIRACESCLELAKETGQAEWSGMDWQHLGVCALERRHWTLAEKHFRKAEKYYAAVLDRDTMAELYAYWSVLSIARGRLHSARKHANNAVRCANVRKLPEFLSRAIFTQGMVEALDDQPKEGRLKMKHGLAIGRKVPIVLLELLHDGARYVAFEKAGIKLRRDLAWAKSVYATHGNRERARVIAGI